jgi:hypothetical protein
MEDTPARPPRASVILYALIGRGGHAVECRVRNLSTTGACVDNAADLAAGDAVSVVMGTLRPLSAEVVWVERGFAGLRFDRSVDIAMARQPRAKLVAATQSGWLGTMTHAYRRQA